MNQAKFGERLRAIREKLGLSGYRVAADAGVDGGLYAKIETGKRHPTDEVLSKLSPVLGVPLDELKAWANADKLGKDGLEGLKRYVLMPEEEAAFQEWRRLMDLLPKEDQAKAVDMLREVIEKKEKGRGI